MREKDERLHIAAVRFIRRMERFLMPMAASGRGIKYQ